LYPNTPRYINAAPEIHKPTALGLQTMLCILNTVFDDKRIAIGCLMTWLIIVLLAFNSIGLFHSDFTRLGPSPTTKIMTLTIDTWDRWFMVAVASFTSTCFNDFFSDSLTPFFLNTIQDQKTKYLPYSKLTCYIIMQLWSVYCGLMSIFSVGLLMSQVDFLLIRLAADLMVNSFTTFKFLQGKEVNRRGYFAESHMKLEDDDSRCGDDRHKRAEEMTDILSEQTEDRPLNPSS
jgi:hypothetical protein